ncbi:hypothetical protein C8T65DRAFT_70534 [Cerioporus squamosus]|nr:hypothetical protein C8T65DRAFT_70534 [Cerioporus squamosus]
MGDQSQPYVQAALAAVKDQSLSPDDAATKVVEQCNQCVANSSGNSADVTQEGDTPGLEAFLWSFWTRFLEIAKDDASMHGRLAHTLAALKAKDSQGCGGWLIWGEPAAWGKLSLFGPVSREEMNGPNPFLEGQGFLDKSTPRARAVLCGDLPANDPVERKFAQSRKEWLNINAFLAKIWALDIVDEHFYGLSTMCMCLEPLSVRSTKGPSEGVESGGHDDPQELEIEVAAIWVKIAGAKMYSCREILGPKGNPNWRENHGCPGGSGGTWDGVDGYHPDRWAHWKQIFSEVAQGNWRKNVTEAAQTAAEAMQKFERDAASA